MNSVSPISPILNNANVHNLKHNNGTSITTNNTLVDSVSNPTAFSSYIEQALMQIGVSNPANLNSPAIDNANKLNSSQKSLSTFIQDLFVILGNEDTKKSTQYNQQDTPNHNEAITAYNRENNTTVGNIINNLQVLTQQLNDKNNVDNRSGINQDLQSSFQGIFDNSNNTTLTDFLRVLMQNLQGKDPLGIIINTQA